MNVFGIRTRSDRGGIGTIMMFILPFGASSTLDLGSSKTIPPGSATAPYNVATQHDPYEHPTSSAGQGSGAKAMLLSSEVSLVMIWKTALCVYGDGVCVW